MTTIGRPTNAMNVDQIWRVIAQGAQMSHRMGVAERRHQPNRTPASQPTPPVLRDADFRAKRSIRLRAGDSSTGGKALGVSAGFTEYAPAVFEEFRRLYRVSIYDLLKALRQPPAPTPETGHDGSIRSKDGCFVAREVTRAMRKRLQRLLPTYFRHVSDDRFNPSLLPEFIGLYALKIGSQPTASYVLTLNPAPSAHRVYRIREADSAREFEADAYVHGRVHVKRGAARLLKDRILKDTEFLAMHSVVGYDLMIGVRAADSPVEPAAADAKLKETASDRTRPDAKQPGVKQPETACDTKLTDTKCTKKAKNATQVKETTATTTASASALAPATALQPGPGHDGDAQPDAAATDVQTAAVGLATLNVPTSVYRVTSRANVKATTVWVKDGCVCYQSSKPNATLILSGCTVECPSTHQAICRSAEMAGLSMCIKAAARDTGVPSSELHISFRNQHDFKLWRRVLVQDKLDAMAPGAEDKGVSRTSKEATRQPTGPIAALTRHDSRSGHLRQPPSPSPPPSKYESDVDITVRDPNPGSGAGDRGAGTPLVSWGGEGGSDDGDIESQVSRMSLSGADRSGSGAQRSGHIAEVSASGEWAPASTPPAAAPTPVGQSACPQSLDEKYENECSDDDQELLRLIEQAERTRERRGLAPGGHWYGNETPRVSRSASARIIDEGDDRSSGDESLEALVTRVHERKRRDRIARQHAIAGSVLRSMLLIAKDDLPAASTARETVSRPWLGEGERVVWAYCEGLNGEEIAVTNQRIVKAMLEDGSVLDEAELWDVTAVDHVKGAFLLKTESITVRYGSRKPVSIAVRSRVCCTYLVRLLEPVCAPLPSQDTQGPGSGTPTSPRYSPPSPPTAAKRPDERKGASTAEAVVRDPGTSIPFNMAECRISQVENQAYTHPLVRKAHLPITHSGVLVRTSRGEQLVGETVVDTIAFNGKPYVAMREYNQEYNTTNWDDDAQTAFFRRRGHYDACEKAWRHTQIDPSTRAPVSFRVGSLCPSSPTEAKLLHQQWVEKVRKSMESLNRGKFGHFNRNCQHAAAYAVNTLAGMQEGRWAEPPNALFRMFGNGSWIPGIEERELGSHADLQGLATTSDAPGSPRDFSVLSIHSGRSSPHPAPLVDPPTRRRTLSHLAALPPPMAGPSTTAAPARPPPKKAALSKEPGVGAVAAETPPDADTPHAYTIHVPSAIIDRKDQVVFYVVRVTSNPHLTKDMPKGGYSLHKRYRDFENFHRRLRAEYRTRFPSGAKASPRHGVFPVLPKKNILRFTSHRDKAFVHGRRTKLQVYIHALLNTPGIPDSEEFRVFFDWPAPGRVVELTALNRKYALDQYPIVFLAYYNSSKKSRRLLKAFKSAARALRGRVLFARLHVDMEPELLASRSLNIKDLDRVPCVRVILRGQGHVPLEDAQCNEQKLTELARAYYKPVSARWRGALGKTLSSVGLSSTPERIGRIIEEYCAVAWRDGVECAAPLAEATADAPRYFFKLVGILGPPERETPRAHKYKNAFSDFVCSLVQKSE